MSKETTTEGASKEEGLLKSSALYKEFLAEREEILRHKWLQSEAQGVDIGFENALLDWMMNHRSDWHAGRRAGMGNS